MHMNKSSIQLNSCIFSFGPMLRAAEKQPQNMRSCPKSQTVKPVAIKLSRKLAKPNIKSKCVTLEICTVNCMENETGVRISNSSLIYCVNFGLVLIANA